MRAAKPSTIKSAISIKLQLKCEVPMKLLHISSAYPGFEPSTALTQSSCKEGTSSFRGTTALMYSISNIFSCNVPHAVVENQGEQITKNYIQHQYIVLLYKITPISGCN